MIHHRLFSLLLLLFQILHQLIIIIFRIVRFQKYFFDCSSIVQGKAWHKVHFAVLASSRFFFASFQFFLSCEISTLLFIHMYMLHRSFLFTELFVVFIPPLQHRELFFHIIYFGYLNSECENVKRSRVSFFNFPDSPMSVRRVQTFSSSIAQHSRHRI